MQQQQPKRVMIIPEDGIRGLEAFAGDLPHKFAAPLLEYLSRFVQQEKADDQNPKEKKTKAEK